MRARARYGNGRAAKRADMRLHSVVSGTSAIRHKGKDEPGSSKGSAGRDFGHCLPRCMQAQCSVKVCGAPAVPGMWWCSVALASVTVLMEILGSPAHHQTGSVSTEVPVTIKCLHTSFKLVYLLALVLPRHFVMLCAGLDK